MDCFTVYEPFTGRFGAVEGGLGVLKITNTLNAIMNKKGYVTANDISEALGFGYSPLHGDLIGIPEKLGYSFMIKTARDENDRIECGILTYDKTPD